MTTKELKQALRKARKNIAKGWTQHWYARTSKGQECEPTDPSAVCFCTWGAIRKVDDAHDGEILKAFQIHARIKEGIPYWNDKKGRTKTQVLKAFDRAIANCK